VIQFYIIELAEPNSYKEIMFGFFLIHNYEPNILITQPFWNEVPLVILRDSFKANRIDKPFFRKVLI
jgi:hypothetical protein